MHFGKALCAAALSFGLADADFMVYTEYPIPSSAVPSNPVDAASFTTSVLLNANIAWGSFTRSLGEPYQSSASSAASEIKDFVASAKNYSIPAVITDPETTTSFFGITPDWYTAMPTGARAFKEQQVSDQYSIVREVIARHATTTGSTGGVMPTPRAGIGAGFGAMAALAAGVFL